MKDIPLLIQNALEENGSFNWIEEHDRFESIGQGFDERNQYDWWKVNNRIRIALKTIEKDINVKLKRGEAIGKREVSLSRIANFAKCDRGTIGHHKRIDWIRDWIKNIEGIIENSKMSNENIQGNNQVVEIADLKKRLEDSRNECAKWFKKSGELEEKNAQLQKTLYHREEALAKRNNEIRELKQEIKSYKNQVKIGEKVVSLSNKI